MIKIYNPTKRSIHSTLLKKIKKYDHKLNLVISYGGDGSLLGADRKYPNLPKLPIRSSKVCNHCYSADNLENILKSILQGQIKPSSHIRLLAQFDKNQLQALNDINIKCQHPNLALRFSFSINDQNYSDNIADGLIVATPFGSTGYFKSIAGAIFSQGLGVAVNNPVNPVPANIVNDNSVITVVIDREDAYLSADNNPNIVSLKPGNTIIIKKSSQTAQVY